MANIGFISLGCAKNQVDCERMMYRVQEAGHTVKSDVVGSDVVAHASSYRKPAEPDSIHSFDHVIFRRAGTGGAVDYGCIHGRVVELTLPEQLEEISSTRIREAVDANRDISHLIDPVAQEFIYRNSLYLIPAFNNCLTFVFYLLAMLLQTAAQQP